MGAAEKLDWNRLRGQGKDAAAATALWPFAQTGREREGGESELHHSASLSAASPPLSPRAPTASRSSRRTRVGLIARNPLDQSQLFIRSRLLCAPVRPAALPSDDHPGATAM